jgi:thiol:disulfide interchange protein DsbD
MESVKSVLGMALCVVAVYFIGSVSPAVGYWIHQLVPSPVVIGFFLLGGILLGGVHSSFHGTSYTIRVRKTMGIIFIVIAIAGFFVPAGKAATDRHGQKEALSGTVWVADINEGLALAKEKHLPVLIDFSAEWCAACKELERYTFSDKQVQNEMKRFICIKADMTNRTPAVMDIAMRFRISGIPVIEFYGSDGILITEKRITGFISADEFLNHIRDIR